MELVFATIDNLYHDNASVIRSVREQTPDLKSYLNEIFQTVKDSTHRQEYRFKRDTTEVYMNLLKMVAGEQSPTIINAQRLLDSEIIAAKKIEKLEKEIQKGSFIQAIVKSGQKTEVFLIKVDNYIFLDDQDYSYKEGFPKKKKIFKALHCIFESPNSFSDVYVIDSSPTQSAYWWKEFLELETINTDEHNTVTSLESILKVCEINKKEFPADTLVIRNSVISYYRVQKVFKLDEVVENLSNYEPFDVNYPKEKLIDRINALPLKKRFDTQFGIFSDAVKKRMSSSIRLTEELSLSLNKEIPYFVGTVKPILLEGVKHLQIKTESGYNAFEFLVGKES